MRIHELTTVDGFIAFDFDCPVSGGGTRMAPDVTRGETILLARAMTYKLTLEGFGKVGGAIAVEAARRGARVVATSTVRG